MLVSNFHLDDNCVIRVIIHVCHEITPIADEHEKKVRPHCRLVGQRCSTERRGFDLQKF